MHVMIDLCVVPLGVGVSVSKYIAECAVRRCHERVHDLGAPRITTTIKVGTRTDRVQTMDEKIVSVQQKL